MVLSIKSCRSCGGTAKFFYERKKWTSGVEKYIAVIECTQCGISAHSCTAVCEKAPEAMKVPFFEQADEMVSAFWNDDKNWIKSTALS